MTTASSTTGTTWVAIDIAKLVHQVLIETPDGRRRTMWVANSASEIERLMTTLRHVTAPCVVAFEPTGDYHRAVMHRLGLAGFALRQVSSDAPPYLLRHLKNVALLTPCFRSRSATATPLSASLQNGDDLALTKFRLPHDRS
jgi:hypothetical protein